MLPRHRAPDDLIQRQDVAICRDAVQQYEQHLKAAGREPSTFWRDRVKRYLQDEQLIKRDAP